MPSHTLDEQQRRMRELEQQAAKKQEGQDSLVPESDGRVASFLRGLIRGIEQSAAAAAAMFYTEDSPYYQEHLLPKLPESGSVADVLGKIGGTVLMFGLGSHGLEQAGRAAMMFPQIASRVPQLSPLAAEIARDIALAPTVEGIRAALGHEVSPQSVLQNMAMLTGAGAAALPTRQIIQRVAPALTRPAVGAAATIGGTAASLPFGQGSLGERISDVGPDALAAGLVMGLLYPVSSSPPPRPSPALLSPPQAQAQLPAPAAQARLAAPQAQAQLPVPATQSQLPAQAAQAQLPTAQVAGALPGSPNQITVSTAVRSIEDAMPGEKLWSQSLRQEVTVVRRNQKTITVQDASGNRHRLPVEDLRREVNVNRPPFVVAPRPIPRHPVQPDAPVMVNPDGAEVMRQQPAAVTVDVVTNNRLQGLFTPLPDVMGEARSLPREEFMMLPRGLRQQLSEIDEQIKQLNAQANRILRRNKVKDLNDLPPEAQEEFMLVVTQLQEMGKRRDQLKPAIIGAMESRGNLGQALIRRIETEKAAGVVPIQRPQQPPQQPPLRESTPGVQLGEQAVTAQEAAQQSPLTELASSVQPGERAVTAREVAQRVNVNELPLSETGRNAFHQELDSIIGMVWEYSVDGVEETARVFRTVGWRHKDIMEVPQSTMEAMRSTTPTWYAKYFGLARDVFGEDVVKPIRDGHRKFATFVNLWQRKLEDILKPVNNPASRERISKLLEGETPPGVTRAEMEAARRLREEFFGANPDSGLFKEFEIDPKQFLEDYLPRIRRGEDLSHLPAEVYQDIRFFAELHRTGELNPRETDVLDIALAYLRSGAKKKFLKPVQDAIEPAVSQMDPNRRELFDTWFGVLMGRPTRDEIMINSMLERLIAPLYRALNRQFPNRPAQELSHLIAEAVHLGTIGGNFFSAIKNLTQQLHVVGTVGPKYWVKAQRALRTQSGKELLNYNWVGQHRVYLQGLELQQMVLKRALGDLSELGFKMFEWADQQNVQTAYMAGLLKALDEGKSLRVAIEEGNATAAMTQFLYGIDSPTLFRTPVGRLFGVLHTYPVNFARMLYTQGTSGQKAQAVKTVAALVLGGYVLSEVTGFNFRSIHPWETLKSHPILSFMRKEFSIPVETAISGYEALAARIDGRDPALIQEATDKFLDNLKKFIPGKTQFDRIATFVRRAMNEWTELDEQGRTRYRVSPGEAIRGLFGPTTEADDRYNLYRKYEELIIQAVDPEAFGPITRSVQGAERVLFGDPAYQLGVLREKAVRLGLNPDDIHRNAMSRVRSYYYGTGRTGFWPAVYRGDIQEAQRYAQVLRQLGVTARDVQQSGQSRDLDPVVVWQGLRIFGGPLPINAPPLPTMRGPSVPPLPTSQTGGMSAPPLPQIRSSVPPIPGS